MNSRDAYNRLEEQARALLDPEADFVANAGNFAALVRNELPGVNWAGFYIDVDSPMVARFSDADRNGLERLVAVFAESLTP